MNLKIRETFKNEIKTLTYKRKISKARSRELKRQASLRFREIVEDENGEVPFWKDARYALVAEVSDAAYRLHNSGLSDARHYNIAYGLLRGVEYKRIENKCATPPSSKKVHEIIQKHLLYSEKREWTLERIESLLK